MLNIPLLVSTWPYIKKTWETIEGKMSWIAFAILGLGTLLIAKEKGGLTLILFFVASAFVGDFFIVYLLSLYIKNLGKIMKIGLFISTIGAAILFGYFYATGTLAADPSPLMKIIMTPFFGGFGLLLIPTIDYGIMRWIYKRYGIFKVKMDQEAPPQVQGMMNYDQK